MLGLEGCHKKAWVQSCLNKGDQRAFTRFKTTRHILGEPGASVAKDFAACLAGSQKHG